jgi:hypothetical protein
MKYLTRDGVDVTKRIESGKTKKFSIDEEQQAIEYAAEKRSYVYELMFESRRVTLKHIGYAVPN